MKKVIILLIILPLVILPINRFQITLTEAKIDDVFIYETEENVFSSFDPALNYEFDYYEPGIIQQIYETLLTYDGSNANLIPSLAESCSISADGLNYTFKLRDDVTFHDGTPFNASCMKYSLDRAIIMYAGYNVDSSAWTIAFHIKGAWNYSEYSWWPCEPSVTITEQWLALNAIEADDAKNELVIHLEKPYVPFLAALNNAFYVGAAISPTYVYNHRNTKTEEGYLYTFDTNNNDTDMVDMGWWFPALAGTGSGIVPGHQNEWMNSHTCGTGPYLLSNIFPDSEILLERNDNWWMAKNNPTKTPAIRQVQYKVVSDVTDRIQDLKDGTCDGAYIPPGNMSEIYNGQTGQVLVPNLKVTSSPTFRIGYMGFVLNDTMTYEENGQLFVSEDIATSTYNAINHDKYGSMNPDASKASQGNPFTALKFRQAFAYAFDYNKFIQDALCGFGERLEGLIPKEMFGHVNGLSVINIDPTQAKILFGDVGWKGNITVAYYTGITRIPRESFCYTLKDSIEDLNVGIKINVIGISDWYDYLNHVRHQHLGLWYQRWSPDYADPDNYLDPFLLSNGTLAKRQVYKNDDIDKWLNEAKTESNINARANIYKNIEEATVSDVAHVSLYQKVKHLVSQDYVQGLEGGFNSNPMCYHYAYYELYEKEQNNSSTDTSDTSTSTDTTTTGITPFDSLSIFVGFLILSTIVVIKRRKK